MAIITNETKKKSLEGKVTLGVGVRMAKTVEVGMAMKASVSDEQIAAKTDKHNGLIVRNATQIDGQILQIGRCVAPVCRSAGSPARMATH